jgi:putative serine protease PepD
MKFGLLWKVIATALLGCAMLWAISFLNRIPLHRITALIGVQPEVAVSVTPTPDASVSLSDVAVQTFSGPLLVRQGSGVVVSADGLILTTTSVAPYGSGSFTNQVALSRGQILRARRMTSDPATGLALLKVDAGDLDAVLFEPSILVGPGASVQAVAATFMFSKFTTVRLPVWVAWMNDDQVAGLSIDHAYGPTMSGARLVNADKKSIGLFNWTGRPTFIGAAKINGFLEQYLQGTPR